MTRKPHGRFINTQHYIYQWQQQQSHTLTVTRSTNFAGNRVKMQTQFELHYIHSFAEQSAAVHTPIPSWYFLCGMSGTRLWHFYEFRMANIRLEVTEKRCPSRWRETEARLRTNSISSQSIYLMRLSPENSRRSILYPLIPQSTAGMDGSKVSDCL